jgi:hypothetical protein
MIEIDYDNYKIEPYYIWDHECDLYLNDLRSEEHISHLKYTYQNLIVAISLGNEEVSLQGDVKPFESGQRESYYNTKVKIYDNIRQKGLAEELKLPYFMSGPHFFVYSQPIVINSNTPKFDYWFALRLSHYKYDLKNIKPFLDYSLEEHFNGDVQEITEFIELIQLQYPSILNDDGLSKIIGKWIQQNQDSIEKPLNNVDSDPTFHGEYRTFLLKKVQNDPGYLNSTGSVLEKITDISARLRNGFIDKDTSITDIKSIFQAKPISLEEKIIWTGTLRELKRFGRELVNSKICIELKKSDHLLIACEIFNKKHGNSGIAKKIEVSQLNSPSGDEKRFKEIDDIVRIITLL